MENKRLEAIINLIDYNKSVIDVGTDHGLVPLYLGKNGISEDILATDISSKSLSKLEERLTPDLRKVIKTQVTDGFKGLEEKPNQIAIIAGMGGVNIIEILKASEGFVSNLDYLILEPNIGSEKLRAYLNENSYKILKEDLVFDKKYYEILKVTKGKDDEYELSRIYFGKGPVEEKNPILREKLALEYPKNLAFRDEILKNSKTKKGLDILEERIRAMEEVLRKWKLESF